MRSLVIFLLFLSLSSSVIAASYQGTCSITFQGSSTLHDFEGKDSCQPFIVNEKDGVLGVPELAVAVSGMDTDNSRRDKKMHAMFEVEAFPLDSRLERTGGPRTSPRLSERGEHQHRRNRFHSVDPRH
ncbi:MAG: hypothetical protein C0619_04035 [Desulfuromonas sp.]|nr:MAG: hypothetical protein C0619_04035 [Desulfuromonas sp.]